MLKYPLRNFIILIGLIVIAVGFKLYLDYSGLAFWMNLLNKLIFVLPIILLILTFANGSYSIIRKKTSFGLFQCVISSLFLFFIMLFIVFYPVNHEEEIRLTDDKKIQIYFNDDWEYFFLISQTRMGLIFSNRECIYAYHPGPNQTSWYTSNNGELIVNKEIIEVKSEGQFDKAYGDNFMCKDTRSKKSIMLRPSDDYINLKGIIENIISSL